MLKKGEMKMIKKFLKEGMSKSAIARKLGISRETARKYALKPVALSMHACNITLKLKEFTKKSNSSVLMHRKDTYFLMKALFYGFCVVFVGRMFD